ncbi:hypothetical protein ACFL3G_07490 [Planctomycetota bacterium]
MMISLINTEFLNAVVLALTPQQRWDAVARPGNSMAGLWFALLCLVAIVLLLMLFLIITSKRVKKEQEIAKSLFEQYARKRGLSPYEQRLLRKVAIRAKLKRKESVYTLPSAFDRGATRMIGGTLIREGDESSKQLRIELAFLREKLGFPKQLFESINQTLPADEANSKLIEIGKKVYARHNKSFMSGDIEATVLESNENDFTIELQKPVEVTFDKPWSLRYYLGPSVWEFETYAVSCNGNFVVLSHSDDIRIINRRRFLRVPVKKPAFVTLFPFAKKTAGNRGKKTRSSRTFEDSFGTLEPPEFVPAVVTELGGPGLIVETTISAKVGDRILLVFRLNNEEKIIESVAVVRHVVTIENGLSLAVELTGLNESDINELIRATNTASITRVNAQKNAEDASADENQETEQETNDTEIAQEV